MNSPFAGAFSALTGYPPMGWQRRLFDAFWCGVLPDVCDIPTGLGKTAVMAVWLIARHLGAPLPRRLVYVVDRRVVVDQATRFAERLRDKTAEALATGTLILPLSTLRGQFADNRQWLEDPAAAAIIIGTVDMIGSRLLFEGYGVSRRMRPFHAGLLGVDALVVLDEAHLCPPFEALLRAVEADDTFKPEGAERRAVLPQFRVLSLSATGRHAAERPIRLEPEDRHEAVVAERIGAAKRLALSDLAVGETLDKALAQRAWDRGMDGKRVLVFCNSREMAQKVATSLRLRLGRDTGRVELLVGARRVRERAGLEGRLDALGFLAGTAGDGRPAFLVATSAGEVGIDLDADHMVCDLVAVERMIQRLGRVNRRGGTDREALVDVVVESGSEPAWKAALAALPCGADGRRDASPAALLTLKDQHAQLVAAATTPAPLRPRLDRPVVDAWSLTSLPEHPGRPEPAPWLRGWVEDEPQTAVVWRRVLPWREDAAEPEKADVETFFEAARPHLSETLETLTRDLLEKLIKRAEAVDGDGPALLALSPAGEFRLALTVGGLRRLAQRKNKDSALRALAGTTAIVSRALGGLDGDGLLDAKAAEPPPCLDDGWSEDELAAIGWRVLDGEQDLPDGWHEIHRFLRIRDADDPAPVIVAALRRKGAPRPGDPAMARQNQGLDRHTASVVAEAAAQAASLGLAEDYRRVLEIAARLHDAGKDRPMWQRAMRAPQDGRPYGKTSGGCDPAQLKIGLHTYRHEFGSLTAAADDPALRALPEDLRDLALHLIVAHHGFARPLIAPADPDSPPSASEALAQDAALRFARLQRSWGPWGLAWWEALLRAADQRASRRLDEEGAA